MTSNTSYPTIIDDGNDTANRDPNHVPEPRKLDDLDAKFWWLFWDWLREQSWGQTEVNAPSIADWLGHQKDMFTIYHLKETKDYDSSPTTKIEVDKV